MKKFLTLVLAIVLVNFSTAQSPQGINYQAIVKNSAGEIMANQNLSLRLCIRQGNANGTITYQEIKSLITNAQGLVTTVIGSGPATIGNFSSLDWSNGIKYLQVDMNFGQGWLLLGTEQLQSVPYALYAETVPVSVSLTGDTMTIGNQPIIIPGVSAANHIFGCTNSAACNYNPLATDNDGTCHITGQSCDDGNALTVNDVYGADCVCAGSTPSYTIGSQGPAGGYVFYDKGSYSNGWRYLEAYPQTVFGKWGCQSTSISGTNTAIGTGEDNSASILAGCTQTNTVAYLISNLTIGGYDDWFLPSRDELSRIQDVLFAPGIGNFPVGFYWSSSQSSAIYGYFYDFEDDFSDIQSKSYDIVALPVRSF
jgi:hypothetical protein